MQSYKTPLNFDWLKFQYETAVYVCGDVSHTSVSKIAIDDNL